MEKEKFMYILEKGYWTMTDLKTKAMKAAYDEIIKHNRKIVHPAEIDSTLDTIMNDAVFAAHSSNGVKIPKIYRFKNEIRMNGNILIRAEMLYVERYTPRRVLEIF